MGAAAPLWTKPRVSALVVHRFIFFSKDGRGSSASDAAESLAQSGVSLVLLSPQGGEGG